MWSKDDFFVSFQKEVIFTATLSVSGPADVWFGIGFGASTMNDKPYAIIIDGNGEVTERKLENHGPGSLLSASVNGKSRIIYYAMIPQRYSNN